MREDPGHQNKGKLVRQHFKNMTQETLDFLHRAYNRIASSPKTSNIIDILEELQMIIELYNAPAEDVDELEIFCKNINSSIKARKKMFLKQ